MLTSLKHRLLSRAQPDRVLHMLAGVQQIRVWTEELEGAVLHLFALPSRQDVRRLHRRVTVLRGRIGELERALAEVERERDEAGVSRLP